MELTGKVGRASRLWFSVATGAGAPDTGEAANLLVSIRNPADTVTSTPAVTESGVAGLYFVDFTPTVVGEYGVLFTKTTGPRSTGSGILRVFVADIDDVAQPGDAMDLVADAVDADAIATDAIDADALATAAAAEINAILTAAHGSGSWTTVDVAEVAVAVWIEVLAAHETTSGSAAEALASIRNRIRIDFTASPPQLVVFDQAGTSELYRADITTVNGTEVLAFFGVQHERGSPI